MAKVAKKLCNFRLPETVIGLIRQMAEDDKKSQAEIVQEAVTLLASGRTFGLDNVRLPEQHKREAVNTSLPPDQVRERGVLRPRGTANVRPFKGAILKPSEKGKK